MIISFLYTDSDQCSFRCKTPDTIPGDVIDIKKEIPERAPYEPFQLIKIFERVTKEVPDNKLLFLDTCHGHHNLKAVSNDCSFFIPENEDELEKIKPYIKDLLKRKIFVLTEVKRTDMVEAIRETCRKSFYMDDGTLINKKFAKNNLSPIKMAESGFKFVGDEKSDSTQCYFSWLHKFSEWEDTDDPTKEHYGACPSCYNNLKYILPTITSKTEQETTGKTYQLIMPNSADDRPGSYCNKAIILSPPDIPVKQIGWEKMLAEMDLAKLDQLQASIEEKQDTRNIDHEHLDLLRQSLILKHFSGLFRKLDQSTHEFISVLESCIKNPSISNNIVIAHQVLSHLKSNPIKKETESTVATLANLEQTKAIAKLYENLSGKIFLDIKSKIEDTIKQELNELSCKYIGRRFIHDYFNDAVLNARFGSLFMDDYFTAPEKNENLMKLSQKGNELLECLNNISDKIHDLLEQHKPQVSQRI